MGAWNAFFSGQLTAAAAFAGLLFVSLSVNQKRILEIERLADRGLEALVMLLLVILAASAALVPGQPLRLVGGEIGAAGLIVIFQMLRLQQLYMPATEETYRRRASRLMWVNRLAVGAIAAAGVLLLVTGDLRSLYLAPVGMLLSFVGAGMSAWVLLIEINR